MAGRWHIFTLMLFLLVSMNNFVVTMSSDRELNPVEVPYPGYLDSLNATLTSLIAQLAVYRQYIDQAFKPLETFTAVFPKPIEYFEKGLKSTQTGPVIDSNSNFTSGLENKANPSINNVTLDKADNEFANVNSNPNLSSQENPTLTDSSPNENVFPVIDNSKTDQPTVVTDKQSNGHDPIQTPEELLYDEYEDHFDEIGTDTPWESVGKSESPEKELQTVERYNHLSFPKEDNFTSRKSKPSSDQLDRRLTIHTSRPKQGTSDTSDIIFERENVETAKCGKSTAQLADAQLKWNVAIGTNEGSGFIFSCGGILMKRNPAIIVTSASCLHKKILTVVRLSTDELHNITHVKLHPQYKENSTYNDIGLVRLEKNIEIDQPLIPCLHPKKSAATPESSSPSPVETIATDWKFKLRKGSLQLQPITKVAELIPNSECENSYRNYYRQHSLNFNDEMPSGIDSSLICARLPGQIPCQKNVGFQLISQPFKSFYSLLGTSTLGKIQCDFTRLPGIYTNISFFAPWIQQNSRISKI